MKAMIFAAGLGTRLKPFTEGKPKALAEVNGKTLLEHSISYLQRFGVHDVIVNVHHFPDMIREAINSNNGFGSTVGISDESDALLETGGGLKKAAWYFKEESRFVVMNVDVLTNLDLGKMIASYNPATLGSLAVMKRESSRQFLFDAEMTLSGWTNVATGERKITRGDDAGLSPLAFSGIHVLSTRIFDDIPFEGKFSLVDLYLYLAKNHVIKGYNHSRDIFIDVGKPESLARAAELF